MAFDPGVLLETERLLLRPLDEDDAAAVLAASGDAEIRRWMPWAPIRDLRLARDWCVAPIDPARGMQFAIVAGDLFAGSVSLGRTDWVDGRVEIGYWISPQVRRRGYAAEAARGAAAYAFEKGMHRVELLAAVGNHASHGVAEKAGFTREGVLRQALLVPSARVDAVLFSLLATDLT